MKNICSRSNNTTVNSVSNNKVVPQKRPIQVPL